MANLTPGNMALERIYSESWARRIDTMAADDEVSTFRAEAGYQFFRAQRDAETGWRLSWQTCDIRAAK